MDQMKTGEWTQIASDSSARRGGLGGRPKEAVI